MISLNCNPCPSPPVCDLLVFIIFYQPPSTSRTRRVKPKSVCTCKTEGMSVVNKRRIWRKDLTGDPHKSPAKLLDSDKPV